MTALVITSSWMAAGALSTAYFINMTMLTQADGTFVEECDLLLCLCRCTAANVPTMVLPYDHLAECFAAVAIATFLP